MRHIFLLLTMFLIHSPLHAESSLLETKVKAAYLYNFTKFVSWPEQNGKPVQICIAGESGVAKILSDLALKQKESDAFLVSSLTKTSPAGCQILYLAQGEQHYEALLAAARDKDILTVSDDPRFAEGGGMITLFSEGGKIRFTINISASRKTNLKISSKLLELSKTMR